MKKLDFLENQVNYAYLAIGSNLGNKILNLELVKYELSKKKVHVVKSSSFYKTKSWPNPKFPEFINAVLYIKTNISLQKLFKHIKLIEKSLGRVKKPKNYPRICDIDIIDFNGKIFDYLKINLTVPHPSLEKRNFVLMPLYEINKNWIHPKTKKNVVNLISKLKYGDIRSIKLI